MKNIFKKLMENKMDKAPPPPPAKKLAPWEVVGNITQNYNKAQQARILELLNQKISPPNPNRR